jgi:hypothetical protein
VPTDMYCFDSVMCEGFLTQYKKTVLNAGINENEF